MEQKKTQMNPLKEESILDQSLSKETFLSRSISIERNGTPRGSIEGNRKSFTKKRTKGKSAGFFADFRITFHLLFPFLKEARLFSQIAFWISLALLIISKVLAVATPLIFKKMVDDYSDNPKSLATSLLISYVIFRVLSSVVLDAKDNLFLYASQDISGSLMKETFAKLHQNSLRFHIHNKPGELVRTMEKGLAAVPLVLNLVLFNWLPAFLETVFVLLILVIYFKWSFLVTPFIFLTLYLLWTIQLTNKQRQLRKEMNQQDTQVSGQMLDSLLNFEIIKCFVQEHEECERYGSSLESYFSISHRVQWITSILSVGQNALIGACLFITLLLAGHALLLDEITIGDFVALNTYILNIWTPLSNLSKSYRGINRAFAALEAVKDLLEEPLEITDAPDASRFSLPKESSSVSVEFENVHFSYFSTDANNNNSKENIAYRLEDVSFRIRPGTTLALVGPSGAGKSTISKLLCRFYEPLSGRILVAGKDIRDVTQRSLRELIGIVPQDTILFNETIAFNVAFGTKDATQEMIEEACKKAAIHDFICTCPDGYQTLVGQRGVAISGGQKQRISLARAFLKNPPLLILDEATSSLDVKTEKEIQTSIEKLAQGRTTLVIAHRLSTIRNADHIVLLKDGTIVAQGTHQELLESSSDYAIMWKMQH